MFYVKATNPKSKNLYWYGKGWSPSEEEAKCFSEEYCSYLISRIMNKDILAPFILGIYKERLIFSYEIVEKK